jgi:hypothetical protein
MIIERSTQGFSGKSLGLALQLWERKEMDQGVRQLVFIAAAVVTAIAVLWDSLFEVACRMGSRALPINPTLTFGRQPSPERA